MFGITLDQDTVFALAAVAIFLVVGFPVHEFAHAWMANRLGDGTARLFGRLSYWGSVRTTRCGNGTPIPAAANSASICSRRTFSAAHRVR